MAFPQSRDLISVLTHRIPGWVAPPEAARRLLDAEPRAVWLDTAEAVGSGESVLALGSRLVTASAGAGSIVVDGASRSGTIFEFLRSELPRFDPGATGAPASGRFALGWVGWLGYGLRADSMGLPVSQPSVLPDAALLYVERAVVFDHASRTVELRATGTEWTAELIEWRDATVRALATAVARDPTVAISPSRRASAVTWEHSDAEYLGLIADCQEQIRRGEAYQLCLTSEAFVDIRPDPMATYLNLRTVSPSHHGSFFRVDGISLLSASPEQFLAVSPDGQIESKPIKGTRPRGSDPAHDARLAAELLASDKERAENLMIVDLVRNDLARVSELGSVRVPGLLEVETYAQVHQLVSTVTGQLRAGLSAIDAVEACFPAGSMTGTPKRRAIEILDRLEQRARGIYSGAFGYFGLDGRVELAMVIRSIVLDGHGATVGAGGGITALSDPAEEVAEVRLKAAVLLSVLGASDFR